MRKILKRQLTKFAQQAKALATRPLLIDWQDKTIRFGIIGAPNMKEITLPTVYEALLWVENRARSAESVIGFGYISNVADLLVDDNQTDGVEDMAVVVSLNIWDKEQDLAWVAMETWARNYKIMQEARKFREEWSKRYVNANDIESFAIQKEREEYGPKPELTPEQERERLRRVWNSGGIHPIG